MADASVSGASGSRFVLFVVGDSLHSHAAIANVFAALGDTAEVEIVDVNVRPDLATALKVMVTPTLLRRADPRKRLFGDLSARSILIEFVRG